MRPSFFETSADLRKRFQELPQTSSELWVGFYKRDSGKGGITYREALDEGLCCGWIDGVRKSVDANSYMIRFTPRRPSSIWSQVNLKRVNELIKLHRVLRAGLTAFQARDPKKSGLYSFENRPGKLDAAFEKELQANQAACVFFQRQPPWYQRTANFWVMSAKKEETRRRRLAVLIQDSERGRTIPPLTRPAKSRAKTHG